MTEYQTVPAAAARLGCSRRNILAMIANGRLKGCVKFGKAWQVPLGAIPEPPRPSGRKKQDITSIL